LLEGKDIATPGGAAEVKRILTAYGENRSQPIKEKIDAFLARPEFQGAQNVAGNVEQPSGAGVSVPSEPNNAPSTGGIESTEPNGVVSPSTATGELVGGESQQPGALEAAPITEPTTQEGTLSGDQTIETQQTEAQGQEAPAKSIGKKAAADKIKAEQGVVAAEQERTKFVEDNDKKADSVMRGILLDTAGKMGVKPQDLPAQSQIGTDEHNMLRLPALLNRYIDLQDIIAKAEEPTQTAKNQRELKGVAEAIAASGGDAPQLLSYLQGLPKKQRDTVISSVTRKAISDFEDRAKGIVEAQIAESKKKLDTIEEYTDADAARDADLINEGVFQKLGIRLFSPAYVGPQLDETGRSLAQKGDLNSLLGHLGNVIKTPEIQRVLRKIQSLGLKTKVVIGDLVVSSPMELLAQ
jgi:hypothetical protein